MIASELLLGIAVLLFGRQLFWLFVGVTGFILGTEFAINFLGYQTTSLLILLIAIITGIIGALLAIILQRIAVMVAGFFAGGILLHHFLIVMGYHPSMLHPVFFIAAGVITAIFIFALFDWGLIIISSLLGASIIVESTNLSIEASTILIIILVITGIVFQSQIMARTQNS